MVRLALGGLSAIVVTALALLLVDVCTGTGASSGATDSGADAAGARRATAGTRPRLPEPTRLEGQPSPGEEEQEHAAALAQQDIRVFIARDLPYEIIWAASSCYDGQEGAHERMTMRYQLRFESGTGVLENVALVTSDFDDQALEDCVITALETFEIRQDQVPDLAEDLSITISLRALERQARGLR